MLLLIEALVTEIDLCSSKSFIQPKRETNSPLFIVTIYELSSTGCILSIDKPLFLAKELIVEAKF